ncbi:MAG: protein kinase domain-containing protein [Actinomycetota bacterium]
MEATAPNRRLAGRYVLEELIDTGGMASVWRARDEVLARIVAVKILREDLAVDPDFTKRFQREAVAAARLTHPNIVSVYDTGVDQGLSYIIMEYSEGQNVREILDQRGSMEPEQAAAVAVPVLSALAYAHANGVVHRDVKPANILVGDDGRVRVTDFGIAKAAFAGTDLTTTGKALGTVRYLSPEQVRGAEVDARSDLYSVGTVLYELLTGRVPFQAESDMAIALMRLNQDPMPPRAFRGGIPRGIEAVVLRAMARDPEDRFQSAESMSAALDRLAGGSELAATQSFQLRRAGPMAATTRTGHAEAPPSTIFRSWMLVPLIVIVLAGAAIAAGLAIGRLELGGPLGVRPAPNSPSPQQPAALSEVTIAEARDFDPQGDGHEHPGDTGLAIDESAETAWGTDHYNSAEFGNLKDGVGLWLDLGEGAEVSRITVNAPIQGWTFQVMAGSTPTTPSDPLPAADGSTTFRVGPSGEAAINLKPVRASRLLIWITRLGPDDGRYGASIADVTVEGPA